MSMKRELSYFLELQVKHTEEGIFINQAKYTRIILKWFNMLDSATVSTLTATTIKLDLNSDEYVDVTSYRVDSLLYLTVRRQDLMYATYLYARFQDDPRISRLVAVKRIFRYLKKTINLGYDIIENQTLN